MVFRITVTQATKKNGQPNRADRFKSLVCIGPGQVFA